MGLSKEDKQTLTKLTKKDGLLLIRFRALRWTRTTLTGHKYLLPPDAKDLRWGIHHFGGCEPITDGRAEKLIIRMEKDQKALFT